MIPHIICLKEYGIYRWGPLNKAINNWKSLVVMLGNEWERIKKIEKKIEGNCDGWGRGKAKENI